MYFKYLSFLSKLVLNDLFLVCEVHGKNICQFLPEQAWTILHTLQIQCTEIQVVVESHRRIHNQNYSRLTIIMLISNEKHLYFTKYKQERDSNLKM